MYTICDFFLQNNNNTLLAVKYKSIDILLSCICFVFFTRYYAWVRYNTTLELGTMAGGGVRIE